mmetsp:Transcript_7773/g.8572  ORF Transcript_7773/g.8572 Transcript_7773/m.8572 type:complete len:780 (+) Transcript_7773:276-2615(+)
MKGDGSGDSTNVASYFIATNRLVAGDYDDCEHEHQHQQQQNQRQPSNNPTIHPVLCSNVPLSFWGGIDERTGIIIDTSHPLRGKNVSNTILVLPSGRGSCTASQVLLELILNRLSPRALILRDRDGLVCVGALVARFVLGFRQQGREKSQSPDGIPVLDVLQVNNDHEEIMYDSSTTTFDTLIEYGPKYGSVLFDGKLVVGQTIKEVEEKIVRFTSLQDIEFKEDTIPYEKYKLRREEDCDVDFDFELSQDERRMLDEASTVTEFRAVEVLIRYARIVTPPASTPTYIDVTRAHIDGCTYIGKGGLRFVEQLVEGGGHVKIPTTLNSVSTDLRHWERLGIRDDETLRNSIRQADAYVALGCSSRSFTCAPYLLEKDTVTNVTKECDEKDDTHSITAISMDIPQKGDQIVWGESNAVVYANTVLGARTEKYADYLDICCAIIGTVPAIGVHLDEYRTPTMILEMEDNVLDFMSQDDQDDSFALLFPVLGHLCGSLSDGEVPLLVGLEKYADRVNFDHLKSFCAAFGTTAASPLIHIAGITPEARLADIDGWKRSATRSRSILATNLQETFDLLDQQKSHIQNSITVSEVSNNCEEDYGDENRNDNTNNDKVDWVALGNPHLSLSEVDDLLRLVENRVALSKDQNTKKHDDVAVFACISRSLYDKSPNVKKLEDFGFTFVRDTCWCMLLEPPMIPSKANATILTNSGKYAHYGPGLTSRKFRFGSTKDCVDAAWTGFLPRRSTNQDVPWRIADYRSFSTRRKGMVQSKFNFLKSAFKFLLK